MHLHLSKGICTYQKGDLSVCAQACPSGKTRSGQTCVDGGGVDKVAVVVAVPVVIVAVAGAGVAAFLVVKKAKLK